MRGSFGAGVSREGLRNAPGIGGRKGKTRSSFPIGVGLDGPGTGVEGSSGERTSGEGHEASRIRLAVSCGGIVGTVGVEIKPPIILGVCGCGDCNANATCGPEVTAERCGGESGRFGEPDREGVPFDRILWDPPRRRCEGRRETGRADIDLERGTSVLRK